MREERGDDGSRGHSDTILLALKMEGDHEMQNAGSL